MDRFRVVIVGGGVAAVEGLLRLRRLAGESVHVTLLAPNDDFALRALSVKEPFAGGAAKRHPLARIVADQGADIAKDTLGWVDVEGRTVHTGSGGELPFDALLIAVGGRMTPAFDHVKTFRDADADELFGGVIQDIEGGYTKRIAFLAPDGARWMLPLYELALMTAERAHAMGTDDVELSLVTPEPWPMAGFGKKASDAVTALLEAAGIDIYALAAAQVPAAGRLVIQPHGVDLNPERMIAMPRVSGPSSEGSPARTRTALSRSTTTAPCPAPMGGCSPRAMRRRFRSSTADWAPSRPTRRPRRSPSSPARTSRSRRSIR